MNDCVTLIKEWAGLAESEQVIELSPENDVRQLHCGNHDRQWKLEKAVDPKSSLPSFRWTKNS